MLFNSPEFLVFFPLVFLLFLIAPPKVRVWVLLIASVLFYMSFVPKFILIIGALIFLDFFCGIWIEGSQGQRRKVALFFSAFSNLAILLHFKFSELLYNSLIGIGPGSSLGGDPIKIILPLGISFHTFQSLSYIFDVYLGHAKAERKLHLFALYVLFFPQMVAGPIERANSLLVQLQGALFASWDGVKQGLVWMLLGYFKKVVIADRLEMVVGPVFDGPHTKTSLECIIGILLYPIQLYCDFSGYTDIGMGAALFFGITLRKNFAQPLLAVSVAEYWKRWNISLSTWFRDYLFGYLVSLRRSMLSNVGIATLIVFALSGLWHGSGWGYLFWGIINGFYLLAWLYSARQRSFLRKCTGEGGWEILGWLSTSLLIAISLVFFRSQNLSLATALLGGTILGASSSTLWSGDLPLIEILFCLFLGLITLFVQFWGRREGTAEKIMGLPVFVRGVIFLGMLGIILIASLLTEGKRFIYYQF